MLKQRLDLQLETIRKSFGGNVGALYIAGKNKHVVTPKVSELTRAERD
jgi:hypothetical protein